MDGLKKEQGKTQKEEESQGTGTYEHVFKTPFEFEGKKYEKLVFCFGDMAGKDMNAVEKEMTMAGEYAVSPELSTAFLSKFAARAAGIGSDMMDALPVRDFNKIRGKARDFLADVD